MILDDLPIARLTLLYEVQHDTPCPLHKGELLHEGLSYWLAVRWCRYRQGRKPPQGLRCENCVTREGCPYGGELIKPLVRHEWSAWAKRQGQTPPPAYTVSDGQDRRSRLYAGDLLQFELALLGARAIARRDEFLAAAAIAGQRGLGIEERVRARLAQVRALVSAANQPPHEVDYERVTRPEELALYYRLAADQAPDRPLHSLALRFTSPIDYEEHEGEDNAAQALVTPEFAPLIRSLVRRVRLLSEAHGGGEWPSEERQALEKLAGEVTLSHDETRLVAYIRKVERGQPHWVRGPVGQAWYEAPDLRPFLPLLWLGQWVHLGKGASYGAGSYEIAQLA